ncbi:MAG: hypothetical protein GC171_06520 [Terrimonas sp.]|nr:hypothetical protein [Terrimonas sp.]
MKRLLSSIWVCIFILPSQAQELNGIWKGTLTQGPGGCFAVYNIELQIQVDGSKVTGASYHYSDLSNYVKEEFVGSYDSLTQTLVINEVKVITFHVPSDCVPCIKKYTLTYSKNGDKELLGGDWGGVTMNNSNVCPPGKIGLNRTLQSAFKDVDQSVPLTARKNELVREIKVDTGTIKLAFYDNATIDGDSISVFLDKQIVLSQQRLTTQPIILNIIIDLVNREHEVVMVAENLGEIPPNTALMIVTAGKKRYQLYLTSTEQKNAMVKFVYEKPQ